MNFIAVVVFVFQTLIFHASASSWFKVPESMRAFAGKHFQKQQGRITVIGGGPVGIGTAYAYAKAWPHVQVDVYEKRLDEIRRYIVAIDKRSREFLGDEPRQRMVVNGPGCMIWRPNSDQRATCFAHNRDTSDKMYSARQDVIVDALESLCNELPNCGVQRNMEVTPTNFDTLTANSDMIIIAAGVRSRKELVSQLFRVEEKGQQKECNHDGYGLAVLFTPDKCYVEDGDPKDFVPKLQQIDAAAKGPIDTNPLRKETQNRFRGFRAQKGENYLAMLIDEIEYKDLEGGPKGVGNVKKLNNYGDLQHSPNVLEAIADGFKFFRFIHHRARKEDLQRLKIQWWAFPIDLTYAEPFVYKYNGKPVFLLGDVNYAPHFFAFSGLNKGMHAAQDLKKAIAAVGFNNLKIDSSMSAVIEAFQLAVIKERDGEMGRPWFDGIARDVRGRGRQCRIELAKGGHPLLDSWKDSATQKFVYSSVLRDLSPLTLCYLAHNPTKCEYPCRFLSLDRQRGMLLPIEAEDWNALLNECHFKCIREKKPDERCTCTFHDHSTGKDRAIYWTYKSTIHSDKNYQRWKLGNGIYASSCQYLDFGGPYFGAKAQCKLDDVEG